MDKDRIFKDELPASFIGAMRTLFDILDVNKSGTIKFSDIESRWQDDPRKGLPKGIIDNLRKVTPQSGLITFGQFCAGLKLSLIRLKSEDSDASDQNNNKTKKVLSHRERPASVPVPAFIPTDVKKPEPIRKPSLKKTTVVQPYSDETNTLENKESIPSKIITRSVSSTANNRPPIAGIVPNNTIAQRTMSMPQLGDKKYSFASHNSDNPPPYISPPPFIPPPPVKSGNDKRLKMPPKPASPQEQIIPSCPPSALNKSGIMTVLQRWRIDKMKGIPNPEIFKFELEKKDKDSFTMSDDGLNVRLAEAPPKPPRLSTVYKSFDQLTGEVVLRNNGRKNLNRKKEPRCHTLANGIDYNMLKRMKQMEQEKDILVQGLESVDKAKEWYLQQIQNVQDKMKYVGRIGSFVESSSDIYQERLNFQMARIFEVNQHLSALVESTDKGFPLHMNLALRQPSFFKLNTKENDNGTVQRLKQQNNVLSEEVNKKGERITQLEREKAALIRELFQARSQHRRDSDDNTLI